MKLSPDGIICIFDSYVSNGSFIRVLIEASQHEDGFNDVGAGWEGP